MRIELTVNGRVKSYEAHPGATLMEVLRRDANFCVKHGCETGECGTCAVLVDGRAINSCIYLAAQARGREVLTIEGLGGPDRLHPLQEAFVEAGAVQCGYCTPAMILVAAELLRENPEPTEADVREAFSGTLCRCTGYERPVQAVLQAAARLRETGAPALPGGANGRGEAPRAVEAGVG